MIYLQQSLPDTVDYMIAGYTVIFGVLFLYILSIGYRFRKAAKKVSLYREQLED